MNKITVNLTALCNNFQSLKQYIGRHVQIMAVVKAEAYGHGLIEVATSLQMAGCSCFGVSDINEAVRLREKGVSGRIVVFCGGTLLDVPEIIHNNLEIVVFDDSQLAELLKVSAQVARHLPVHLKIDCGMGRLGFSPDEVFTRAEQILNTGKLDIVGVMSHFSCADQDRGLTMIQNDLFTEAVGKVEIAGVIPTPQRHIANSAGMLASTASQKF